MSYYGLSFAGINQGWYRKTTDINYTSGRDFINKYWNSDCDLILEKYVLKFGVYYSSFSEDIMKEIDILLKTDFYNNVRYYEYYISNRVFEIEKLRDFCNYSYNKELNKKYQCKLCNKIDFLLNCHPEIIKKYSGNPLFCRNCDYIVKRYSRFDDQIINQLYGKFKYLDNTLSCDFCMSNYKLNDILNTFIIGETTIDCLYPNLFVNVCKKCFIKCFSDYKRGNEKYHLDKLYSLFLLINKIPTQDFESYFYLFKDKESIKKLILLLKKTRSPSGFKEEFGSFFAALVKSNIIPKGSKKLVIGTMLLSNDNHLCLSLVEKEIDDYLFSKGISHKKEVYYPNSKMRCDWEIFIENYKKRIFIEYFGLINNPDYAKKAEEKKKIAKNNNILLIDIYPKDDWILKINSLIYATAII